MSQMVLLGSKSSLKALRILTPPPTFHQGLLITRPAILKVVNLWVFTSR
jgi:hypothetical protein